MKFRNFFLIILCFLCLGCGKESDSLKFKKEFEQYNQDHLSLEISDTNFIQYKTLDEINSIIKSGTGVIFIGDPQDDLSRKVVSVLLEVANNTDLDVIYYIHTLDGIENLDTVVDKKIPLVLFVLDGEIVQYHVGTIEDQVNLEDAQLVELYNIYLTGIHEVLQDTCDERC